MSRPQEGHTILNTVSLFLLHGRILNFVKLADMMIIPRRLGEVKVIQDLAYGLGVDTSVLSEGCRPADLSL